MLALQIRELGHPAYVYTQAMDLIHRLAACGLVHCDFNEFNLLINEREELTLIDFPQMVSVSHANAEELFERDVDCIVRCVSFSSTSIQWTCLIVVDSAPNIKQGKLRSSSTTHHTFIETADSCTAVSGMLCRAVLCAVRFFNKKIGYMAQHDESLDRVRPSFNEAAADAAAAGASGRPLEYVRACCVGPGGGDGALGRGL